MHHCRQEDSQEFEEWAQASQELPQYQLMEIVPNMTQCELLIKECKQMN